MEIINIFAPCLYSFKFSDQEYDEFYRVFYDEWTNPLFLYEFFELNEKDINITIEEAIEKVKREADFLRNMILDYSEDEPNTLSQIFKNLSNSEYRETELSQKKARNKWLRLYAIKIDENNYVITGGAIKLDNQHLMKDKEHTRKELIKINRCRDFLKEEGVIDDDSFQEIFF